MAACGIDLDAELQLHQVDFYTSHEALLLGYEEALTRRDSLTDDWYDCSAHLLWIGERTRQLDGAHVEFLSGVENPVGVKLGPDGRRPRRCVALCERLNPDREPGPAHARQPHGRRPRRRARCRRCCARCATAATRCVWMCDPMHGNTFQHASGYKTRALRRRDARARTASSPRATPPTCGPAACTSSSPARTSPSASAAADEVLGDHLEQRYETMCDPRLNARQSLDLAFQTAELLRR